MNKGKIIFWISTGLLSAILLKSAFGGLFYQEIVGKAYNDLGYPAHLVIPLSLAKIAAVISLITRKWKWLTEWTYAGLCFEFIIAFTAHLFVGDNQWGGAAAALVLLFTSYISWKSVWKIPME